MPFPELKSPIPVSFISEELKVVQLLSSLDDPLKNAVDVVIGPLLRQEIEKQATAALVDKDTDTAFLDDPVLETIDQVVSGIIQGDDLSQFHDQITKYISNQQDRSELLTNLLLTNDYRRLVNYTKVRNILEKRLLIAATRSDLSVTENMAFLQLIKAELDKIEGRIQGGSNNVSDVVGLLNKVDFTVQQHEQVLKKRFSKTTPAGREIVRRVIHTLRKLEADKT